MHPSQQQLFSPSLPLRSTHQMYSEESPVEISDALAGHLHQVQVRARDEVNSDSQWSEWSPLLLVRPWEGQKERLLFTLFSLQHMINRLMWTKVFYRETTQYMNKYANIMKLKKYMNVTRDKRIGMLVEQISQIMLN